MQATRMLPTPENPVATPPPLSLQTRMVLLSYFAYFFYYFSRKHLGVVTPALMDSGYSDTLIGGAESTASADIINGIGSTAQLFAGIVPIWLKNTWGWDAVFVSFIVLAGISCVAVLPVAGKQSLAKL